MAHKYLEQRGLGDATVEGLNEALRIVLDSIKPRLYENDGSGLTEEERKVLTEGGMRLEDEKGLDPFVIGTAEYAAMVHSSRSTKEVAEALEITPGRVRQMIADRSLYSFVINNRRFIPSFQIQDGKLVGNITKINQALPVRMHPVAVSNWYALANQDLVVNDEAEQNETLSPLAWLTAGYPLDAVLVAASYL